MRSLRLILATIICALLGALSSALAAQAATTDKVPIATSSPEARDLYLKGRDRAERLRATDGRRFYEQAVAKTPQATTHGRSTGPKCGPTNFQTLQIVRETALFETSPACRPDHFSSSGFPPEFHP